MMVGQGPYGPIEMGGMFTMVKFEMTCPRGNSQIQVGLSRPLSKLQELWTRDLRRRFVDLSRSA